MTRRRSRRSSSWSKRTTIVVCALIVANLSALHAREEDEPPSSSPWSRWVHDNVKRIQRHQQNVERAVQTIKHVLQVSHSREEEQQRTRQALLLKLWEKEGCRMGYVVNNPACAVEERDSGAISEVRPAVESQSQSQEPYIGMVLEVYPVDRGNSDYESDDNFAMEAYELLEPVALELGTIPRHHSDYAYKPVSTVGQTERDASLVLKSDSPVEVIVESAWWQWWFSVMGARGKRRGTPGAYERVGKRAFAGGSHGEVWRGRRRCGQRDESLSPKIPFCDENRPLILKRLRIERGTDILEAGLREVYVGNILANQAGVEDMFTVYVDHFFREVPKPAFTGGGQSKELELWIVFEEAGASLRSYLYTPVSSGSFVIHQPSSFWTTLRMKAFKSSEASGDVSVALRRQANGTTARHATDGARRDKRALGKAVMREILRHILTAAAFLHERGIMHRDIKPSNVLCRSNVDVNSDALNIDPSQIHCVLGDFSSVWDSFTDQNLYSNGPSHDEQTVEYSPPEALFSNSVTPFCDEKPQSYDSWSIGVLALELLLGTPNVFSVDQRTTALLTNKMQKEGATASDIERALYLAALSQFCIYMPSSSDKSKSWPLRHGDPLHNAPMTKESCNLGDFHRALRARDPLGIGFDSSADALLHLVWNLLSLDPLDRMTASEALQHPYFTVIDIQNATEALPNDSTAVESLMLDPRMDMIADETPTEFFCPKCGRKFTDWQSCRAHATTRKHAKFCEYDRSKLPTCLNAHSMLPAHPSSGYCDIQGRRPTIEDFHSIHLQQSHQFFGVLDGHMGNLASKYGASMLYYEVRQRLLDLHTIVEAETFTWKQKVARNLTDAFQTMHENFLNALAALPGSPVVMDQSGTTATAVYVTEEAIVVAGVGDSRAVMASFYNMTQGAFTALALTTDHLASDPEERRSVEERGGIVTVAIGGVSRVNGTLAITRSIGDADLSPILSRVPSVQSMTRSEFKELCGQSPDGYTAGTNFVPCFIVLASDGLWDVISNQEAVDMVVEVVAMYNSTSGTSWEDGGAFQEAAERLTQEAYVRGSSDNIGVCVIAV